MYKVDLDPTLRQIIKIFHHLGIWQNEEGFNVIRVLCKRILYFLQYLSFCIIILTTIYYCDDESQIIYLSEAEIMASVLLVKLCYLLWRKDLIFQFLYDPILNHYTADRNEMVAVKEKMKTIFTFNKIYVWTMNLTLFFSHLVPLWMFVSDGVKMLPLFINFNWKSDYDMVAYSMAFVYLAIGCLLSVSYTFAMLFIWYIMFNYAIEYKMLGDRFRSLGATNQNSYQQELINLILIHNNLYE